MLGVGKDWKKEFRLETKLSVGYPLLLSAAMKPKAASVETSLFSYDYYCMHKLAEHYPLSNHVIYYTIRSHPFPGSVGLTFALLLISTWHFLFSSFCHLYKLDSGSHPLTFQVANSYLSHDSGFDELFFKSLNFFKSLKFLMLHILHLTNILKVIGILKTHFLLLGTDINFPLLPIRGEIRAC